jgi:hypothetical protein
MDIDNKEKDPLKVVDEIDRNSKPKKVQVVSINMLF